jgi:hypothetical protein
VARVAPFPFPTHRTGRADFRHPALRLAASHGTLRQALGGLRHPFDIIVLATNLFWESKGVIGGLAYPANKYGKVIYEAA